MSNYGNCIEWVLRLEDRKLSGTVKDLGDGAGLTRFGITQSANIASPDFFTCPAPIALREAKDIYWAKFWVPLQLTKLQSDELAATILSFAVNDGIKQAVKIVQRAFGWTSPKDVDGDLGPITLAAILDRDGSALAQMIRERQLAFYESLEHSDLSKRKFAAGWAARAQIVYPDLPA